MKYILSIILVGLIPAAAQEIIVVKPSTAPQNVRVGFSNQGNNSTLTITDNKGTLAPLVKCRLDSGEELQMLLPAANIALNTITVQFPASGGPFGPGYCVVNKSGGVGPPGVGTPGPPAYAPIAPWDAGQDYTSLPPASTVSYQGSSYVALAPSNSDNPVTPGTDPTVWSLLASVGGAGPPGPPGPIGPTGASGSGSGDVVGPAGGVTDGQMAVFDQTTGKLIRKTTLTGVLRYNSGSPVTIANGITGDVIQQNGLSVAPGPALVATDTGAQNAPAGCPSPAVTLKDGLQLLVRAAFANTGATTFSFCGGSAKSVRDGAGADLASGDITAYTTATPKHTVLNYCAACNSAGGWWELLKTGGGSGGGGTGLPSMTGKAGQWLGTNGTAAAWHPMIGIDGNGNPDGTVFPELAGNNAYSGHESHPPSSIQSLTQAASATEQITCDRAEVSLATDAATTLTSVPQILPGTIPKQRCRIVNNSSASTRTLILGNDASPTVGSGLTLQAAQVAIPGLGRFVDFEWDAASSKWVQSGVTSSTSSSPVMDVIQRGDLQTYSTHTERLPLGLQFQVLMSDPSTSAATNPTGLKWINDFWDLSLIKDTDATLAANTNGRVATQAAVKSYIDNSSTNKVGKIAHGTAVIPATAIAANTCVDLTPVTAAGVATSDVIHFNPNANVTALTGWNAAGTLVIWPTPQANAVLFSVCNKDPNTAITPASITLNWSVDR